MGETLALALPLCGLIVLLIGALLYREHDHAVERKEMTAELLDAMKAQNPILAPPLPPMDLEPEPDLYDDPVFPTMDIDEMMETN